MKQEIKFGFLAHLLEKLGEKRYYGLIVTQKIVYFLKEAFHVRLPYEFYFYHFGPYDDSLDWDLRVMEGYGLIDIGADPAGTGYSIEVNHRAAAEYFQEAEKFVEENEKVIDRVLKLFGNYTPSELELASTIHFVWQNNKSIESQEAIRNVVVEKVKKLKPKFTEKQIQDQLSYLTEEKVIA